MERSVQMGAAHLRGGPHNGSDRRDREALRADGATVREMEIKLKGSVIGAHTLR